jgi:hypothetical protein
MPLSREPFFLRMAICLRGLERWYLVLGGVAVGRGFKSQSDLELSFAKILIEMGLCICTSPQLSILILAIVGLHAVTFSVVVETDV